MEIDKDLFKQYAALKIEADSIETRLSELKEEVHSQLYSLEDDGIEIKGVGRFFKVRRKNWKYTDDVKLLENELKELKKTQEAKGIADYVEVESFMFRIDA